MPGYYIHLAACGGNSLENRSFVIGVEAPDMLKKYVKLYGEQAGAKYDTIKTVEMPNYSELETFILQKSSTHFGVSSNPDVLAYWETLNKKQKSEAFYKGYAWHLLTDMYIYRRLSKEYGEKSLDKNELHNDWNKINALVRDEYHISLTPEVLELGVVKFVEGIPVIVDWATIKSSIDYLRTFNPLGNMKCIMEEIINNK